MARKIKEYGFVLRREYRATSPFVERPEDVVLLGHIEYKNRDVFVFGSRGRKEIPCLPSYFNSMATIPLEGFPKEWQEFLINCKWDEYDHFEGFVLDNRLDVDHVLAMYRDQHLGLREIVTSLKKDLE